MCGGPFQAPLSGRRPAPSAGFDTKKETHFRFARFASSLVSTSCAFEFLKCIKVGMSGCDRAHYNSGGINGGTSFVRCEHTKNFELSHAVGSSALES
jgi:hypothetical protein